MSPPDMSQPEPDVRRLLYGPAAFYGGSANVVLQMAVPAVGYGVLESRVDSGRLDLHPLKRGRTTLTYLAVAMLGTEEDRLAYRRAVDRVHALVRSDEHSPVPYNAFDPDLQLWVAACLYVGARDAVTRMQGPLDDDVDAWFYAYAARLGTTLQVPPERWPADRAAFAAYWQERLAGAHLDPPVRDYLRDLVRFRFLPWWLRPAGRFLAFMNTGYLPPELRTALGLRWGPRRERLCTRVDTVTGLLWRRLPMALRTQPFGLCLADLRRRVRSGRPLV
jgi:uncharacterized protein (DUF2236 family)